MLRYMNVNKIIDILNKMNVTNEVNESDLLEMLAEYLEDKKFNNSDKFILFIKDHPSLIEVAISKVSKHFIYKYEIKSVSSNGQVLYYFN